MGSVTIRNLALGNSYSYSGNIYCTYYYDYWVEEEKITTDSEGNSTSTTEWVKYTTTATVSSGTASITIYTHPGILSTGATSIPDYTNNDKNIIANVLSENWINNTWIPHFEKAYKWWYQDDVTYSNINDLRVIQNNPITAIWFNNCMKAMNVFGKNYRENYEGGPQGDIIYASTINQLNFSGKRLI